MAVSVITGELTCLSVFISSGSGRSAPSPLARHMAQELRGTNRLAEQEIRTFGRSVVPLPSCHHSNTQRRTLLARLRNQIPSTRVRESNVGYEHLELGALRRI